MADVNELKGIKIGDTVVVLIGNYQGQKGSVVRIETEAGSISGWFTVDLGSGKNGYYTGLEIRGPL